MFTTRLRALSVFVVLAAAGSGLLLAQSPQAVGTWVGVGTADNPFGNGAHVDVGDGHTLIVGGTGPDGAATNVVANFDTATNQFAIAGTLLSARTGHTATLLKNGRVLVTGGTTNSLVSTDIELFDPSTGVVHARCADGRAEARSRGGASSERPRADRGWIHNW